MNDQNYNEILFDSLCKAAFTEYIMNEAQTLPLKSEVEVEFPVSVKGKKRLERAFKTKKSGRSMLTVTLKRVAVILLATTCFVFGVLLSNNEIRASIKKTIVEWCGEYIDFNFKGHKDVEVEIEKEEKLLYDYVIGYIPEGFEIVDTVEYDYDRTYTYFDSSNGYICVSITNTENAATMLDNENVEFKEISINGNSGYLVYDNVSENGNILWTESIYTFYITGTITKQELIKIAENIK